MKVYERATAVAVTAPLAAGMIGVPAIPSQEESRIYTYVGEGSLALGVSATMIHVPTPSSSAIPLTVSTFVPDTSPAEALDVDYFDVDFGDPDPFVVPVSWVEQFSTINPDLGLRGPLFEEDQ